MNWTAPAILIQPMSPDCVPKAEQIAQITGLAVGSIKSDKQAAHEGRPAKGAGAWRLLVDIDAVRLARPDNVSISIDFIDGKASHRASESNFKKQPLARAFGLHKLPDNDSNDGQPPQVIDATAGLGTDAWMIASLGCKVTLLEQSPVLCVLLQEAINDAMLADASASTANLLELINVNSIAYLQDEASARADIIYLDPMYPAARKQALVKKGMQLLHELIGPDDNGQALLLAALSKANYRVVVKRPKGAPQLEGAEQWSGQKTQVESPNTRFDIYHIGK